MSSVLLTCDEGDVNITVQNVTQGWNVEHEEVMFVAGTFKCDYK